LFTYNILQPGNSLLYNKTVITIYRKQFLLSHYEMKNQWWFSLAHLQSY